RRGLDPRGGALIGVALAAGLLTKVNFTALLPAVALALALLVYRTPRETRRRALESAGLAVAVAAVPVAIYALLNVTVYDRPALGFGVAPAGIQAGTHVAAAHGFRRQLSFAWQLFLPKLPFMQENFWSGAAGPALYKQWIDGL